ncbi:MAG: hypothetical protein ABEI99_03640 [Halobaculum sp.]
MRVQIPGVLLQAGGTTVRTTGSITVGLIVAALVVLGLVILRRLTG